MSEKRTRLLLVGVGGQGVITAARILGDAAHEAGYQVVVGQLHGMSQRGGSMECSVLIGTGLSSYLTRADVVVGFEPLEVLRARHRMGAETKVLLTTGRVVLPHLVREKKSYPPLERILADVREVADEVVVVDGPGELRKVGETRALNVFMLGALVGLGFLPFGESGIWSAVAHRCESRYLDANRKAFALGRASVAGHPSWSRDKSLSGKNVQ